MSLGRDARAHLRVHRHGVLSTLSLALEGYPFGSVVPYALDATACPVILTSRLAEHTRNFTADARVSLLVRDPGTDPQAQARVTLLGRIAALARDGTAPSRYLRYFPHARDYLALDFDFYRIEPVTLRVVAGFGKIHWVSREAYAPPAGDLAAGEEALVARLNASHGEALRARCGSTVARQVALVGLDCDGFDVIADGNVVRHDFDRPIASADEAFAATAGMIQAARAR